MASAVTVRPANEVRWEDLEVLFEQGGDASRCWCQRYKMAHRESWRSVGPEELAFRFRGQTDCGGSGPTTGLVAFQDGEPVGWCAVEPRANYPRLLLRTRVPWEGRSEVKTDESVWAVTCFVTRKGFRRRGISRALARAAVDHARAQGARALEAYPIVAPVAENVLIVELQVGTSDVFLDAGFTEVSRPSVRRAVMRIDF